MEEHKAPGLGHLHTFYERLVVLQELVVMRAKGGVAEIAEAGEEAD